MTETREPFGQRWYDTFANMASAMEMLRVFPASFRQVVAKSLIERLDQTQAKSQSSSDELDNEMVKSLGGEKVLSFFQSQQKRRWYDSDPLLFRGIQLLSMASNTQQLQGIYFLRVTLEAIQEYIARAGSQGTGIFLEEIEQIGRDVFSRRIEELSTLTAPRPEKEKQVVLSPSSTRVVGDTDGELRITH
jgi:hypothetical protein